MRRGGYWIIILALFALLIVVLALGCTRRSNPERALTYPEGTLLTASVDWNSLEGNAYGDPARRNVYIYCPPGFGENSEKEYPVLYLLHGYAERYHYFDKIHQIQKVADRLITSKQIQPMLIVMPDCFTSFGGSYYTNSEVFINKYESVEFGGSYEDFIISELRAYIDGSFPIRGELREESPPADSLVYRKNRAIGGYDMGGYGALKLAMKYPQYYGSISAMSPYPTHFTYGETDTVIDGLELTNMPQEWIDVVFGENGFSPGNVKAYYSMFDSVMEKGVYSMPHTARLFAMASAFSPHSDYVKFAEPETVSTFFKGTFMGALGIDLPMDASGNTMYFAWKHLWRKHDLKILLDSLSKQRGINPFEEIDIYMDCGSEDDFALTQVRLFDSYLDELGIDHHYEEYTGYGDFFAGGDNFLHDRFDDILKFHSRSFPKLTNLNAPQIVYPTGSQEVNLGSILELNVEAEDADGDSMILGAKFVLFEQKPVKNEADPLNDTTNATFEDFGNGKGLLTFIPKENQVGLWVVRFRVSDGELWSEKLITIRVKK
ncbi:MAG: hypothetical protein AMJ90_08185 [candidate division Zixibacteria bacterium SM23_73_2]|nr:MAG: hypothetical protein AMJ90_08185 [candidate division Zixibacteria bacterium SM23_73_2]